MKKMALKRAVSVLLCITILVSFAVPVYAVSPLYKGAMPTTGNVNVLVLPVEFSEAYPMPMPENYEIMLYNAYFREYDGDCEDLYTDTEAPYSAKDYFYKASYGRLSLDGIILPLYRVPHKLKYSDLEQLIGEALAGYIAAGIFDPADYDSDGDGYIDCLSMVTNSAPGSEHAIIQSEFDVHIGDTGYALRSYMQSRFERDDTLSTFNQCHEMAHMLGCSDHYWRASSTSSFYGIDDLMNARGFDKNQVEIMVEDTLYINIFDKYLMGWIEPIIITDGMGLQEITIQAQEILDDSASKAVILIPEDTEGLPFTEFFILEYRSKTSFAAYPGVVIWHVATDLHGVFGNGQIMYFYDNPSSYLKPVKVGYETVPYREFFIFDRTTDMYTAGEVFSPETSPNSNFYDDVYTGIYMEVLETRDNSVTIKAGFLEDMEPPTATVSYSTTAPTNGSVTATITPSESVTVTNNGGRLSYTFTENGSFTFEFVDAAGNTGTAIATVNNIDKVAPTAMVSYSTTSPTNGSVTATITPSEAVTVTNNGGRLSYTFTENGSFTFEFVDAAGNTGTAIATVDWIDKTAPTATVSYSTTAPTNGSVTATITPSESVTVTNNSGSLEYTFTENGSFTFEFVDAVGNTGTAIATVNWIKKIQIPQDVLGHWAESEMRKVIESGLMEGYPDGTFLPEKPMTRAEMAVLICRYLGIDPISGNRFTDTESHWAKGYIAALYDLGIVEGYNAETFNPEGQIAREEIVVLLNRIQHPEDTTPPEVLPTDDAEISDWARQSVYNAYTQGWVDGFPDGSFQPKGGATRAQIAALFSRL